MDLPHSHVQGIVLALDPLEPSEDTTMPELQKSKSSIKDSMSSGQLVSRSPREPASQSNVDKDDSNKDIPNSRSASASACQSAHNSQPTRSRHHRTTTSKSVTTKKLLLSPALQNKAGTSRSNVDSSPTGPDGEAAYTAESKLDFDTLESSRCEAGVESCDVMVPPTTIDTLTMSDSQVMSFAPAVDEREEVEETKISAERSTSWGSTHKSLLSSYQAPLTSSPPHSPAYNLSPAGDRSADSPRPTIVSDAAWSCSQEEVSGHGRSSVFQSRSQNTIPSHDARSSSHLCGSAITLHCRPNNRIQCDEMEMDGSESHKSPKQSEIQTSPAEASSSSGDLESSSSVISGISQSEESLCRWSGRSTATSLTSRKKKITPKSSTELTQPGHVLSSLKFSRTQTPNTVGKYSPVERSQRKQTPVGRLSRQNSPTPYFTPKSCDSSRNKQTNTSFCHTPTPPPRLGSPIWPHVPQISTHVIDYQSWFFGHIPLPVCQRSLEGPCTREGGAKDTLGGANVGDMLKTKSVKLERQEQGCGDGTSHDKKKCNVTSGTRAMIQGSPTITDTELSCVRDMSSSLRDDRSSGKKRDDRKKSFGNMCVQRRHRPVLSVHDTRSSGNSTLTSALSNTLNSSKLGKIQLGSSDDQQKSGAKARRSVSKQKRFLADANRHSQSKGAGLKGTKKKYKPCRFQSIDDAIIVSLKPLQLAPKHRRGHLLPKTQTKCSTKGSSITRTSPAKYKRRPQQGKSRSKKETTDTGAPAGSKNELQASKKFQCMSGTNLRSALSDNIISISASSRNSNEPLKSHATAGSVTPSLESQQIYAKSKTSTSATLFYLQLLRMISESARESSDNDSGVYCAGLLRQLGLRHKPGFATVNSAKQDCPVKSDLRNEKESLIDSQATLPQRTIKCLAKQVLPVKGNLKCKPCKSLSPVKERAKEKKCLKTTHHRSIEENVIIPWHLGKVHSPKKKKPASQLQVPGSKEHLAIVSAFSKDTGKVSQTSLRAGTKHRKNKVQLSNLYAASKTNSNPLTSLAPAKRTRFLATSDPPKSQAKNRNTKGQDQSCQKSETSGIILCYYRGNGEEAGECFSMHQETTLPVIGALEATNRSPRPKDDLNHNGPIIYRKTSPPLPVLATSSAKINVCGPVSNLNVTLATPLAVRSILRAGDIASSGNQTLSLSSSVNSLKRKFPWLESTESEDVRSRKDYSGSDYGLLFFVLIMQSVIYFILYNYF